MHSGREIADIASRAEGIVLLFHCFIYSANLKILELCSCVSDCGQRFGVGVPQVISSDGTDHGLCCMVSIHFRRLNALL
jgi:hypothetical protein